MLKTLLLNTLENQFERNRRDCDRGTGNPFYFKGLHPSNSREPFVAARFLWHQGHRGGDAGVGAMWSHLCREEYR